MWKKVLLVSALSLYILSFFLPVTYGIQAPLKGYQTFWLMFTSLFRDFDPPAQYLMRVIFNLSNFAFIGAFIFSLSRKRLRSKWLFPQAVAGLLSSLLPLLLILTEAERHPFFIGYYAWLSSYMLLLGYLLVKRRDIN